MKLTINRDNFFTALEHGKMVVEKRPVSQIFSHILLKAEKGGVQLTSTDLEFSIVEKIPAQVEQEGSITASASLLAEIISSFKAGAEVSLAFDPQTNQTTISSGASNFKLPSLSPAEFPLITKSELPYNFLIPASQLRDLIQRTRFAMSTEETRYFLNGIYFHISSDKTLRAVATDGHRLAQASVSMPSEAEGMPGVIISRRTVNKLLSLLSNVKGDVHIGISESQICVRISNIYITSRLVDGTYPDYAAVIPQANNKIMKLKIKVFLEAANRVATILDERLPAIRMNISKQGLILTSKGEDSSTAREKIEIEYNDEELDISFNAKYLLALASVLVEQIKSEEAVFCFSDSFSPILVRTPHDDSSVYVLMPMRV